MTLTLILCSLGFYLFTYIHIHFYSYIYIYISIYNFSCFASPCHRNCTPPPAVDSAKASLIWFMNGDMIPRLMGVWKAMHGQ